MVNESLVICGYGRTSEDGRFEELYELVDLNERVDSHF
jgi:hypothetical protein